MKNKVSTFSIPTLIFCLILVFRNSIIIFANSYLVNPIFSLIEQSISIDIAVVLITLISGLYYFYKFRKEITICSFRISILALIITIYLFCRNSEQWKFTSFSFNSHLFYFDTILMLGFIELTIQLRKASLKFIDKHPTWKSVFIFIEKYKKRSFSISKYKQLKRWIIQRKKKKDIESIQPFIYDNPTLDDDYKRRDYANNICDKLISTYNSSHKSNSKESLPSFTVGISGDWGSGKTSFLKLMKSYLENNNQICYDFSPWLCNSSNEVISEFFKMLRKKLSPYNGNISKTSSNYLRSLVQTDDHWFSKVFSLFMSDKEPSGEEYDKLNEDIKNINKPVFIFIDDLDRLNADEMKEVFNLIRNTANFTNTFFILAYDREYVYNIIKNNGIKKSEHYLDKFINLDIELPMYDSNLIHKIIIDLISKSIKQENHCKQIIDFLNSQYNPLFVYNGIQWINNYFPSIRDIKRFINLFNSSLYSFEYSNNNNDINALDLFILELLKLRHRYFYNILKQSPANILKNENNKYIIKDNYKDDIKEISINYFSKEKNEETKEKEESSFIKFLKKINSSANEEECTKISLLLNELFVLKFYEDQNSLCYNANYNRYFSFRLDDKSISNLEFISIVNKENVLESFAELVSSGKGESLYHNLKFLLPSDLVPVTSVLDAICSYSNLKDKDNFAYDNFDMIDLWIEDSNDTLLFSVYKLFNIKFYINLNLEDDKNEYKNKLYNWFAINSFLIHKAIFIKYLCDNSELNNNNPKKQNIFSISEIKKLGYIVINNYFINYHTTKNRTFQRMIPFLKQNLICNEIIKNSPYDF
ncbi:hypothetical protein SDC9_60133 [bioreactor metagenome]|uniref:KAP NTPase domain-containing protein n=1 Tax=bioreactor metagenome TaxID=1076179 RepID=A0A644XI45_9ZZZZ